MNVNAVPRRGARALPSHHCPSTVADAETPGLRGKGWATIRGSIMSKPSARRLLVGAAVTLTMVSYQVGTAAAAPPGTHTAAAEAAACASLYSVPVNIGPEPLSACSWDMRAIHATPAES